MVLTKKNAYNIGILDNDDHVERILLKNHLHNDIWKKKYSKNCEWCPLSLLIGGIAMNIKVVVLNCQKCNVYLFTLVYSRKALGLLFEVLHLSMCLSH